MVGAALWAASIPSSLPDAYQSPTHLDRGAPGLARCLQQLRTRASLLMVNAHPDDEDGGMLAYETRGLGARCALMSLTRGEGGQNAMSLDFDDALGVLRTQELLAADRYYGVDQYWSSVIDYGFSKTREEAESQWGHDRVLSDVVRVIRMTRPLVVTSVFAGAPTDGHGNHQISGQMAQEAFAAAGDPKRFPEQLREGLRPWSPSKVYERVPFFSETKEGIYDYATDKYVPVRFFDYVHKTWISGKPETDIEIPEGKLNDASGFTFLQIGREGLGLEKSQNGGLTIPEPSFSSTAYHRYGSRVPAGHHEGSFYDGIDVSLTGIASLADGDTTFLTSSLAQIDKMIEEAAAQYRPNSPQALAPVLADGLAADRALIAKVSQSSLPEPGKDDVLFELSVKEKQFTHALNLALAMSLDASVAPETEATSSPFGPPPQTFQTVIPGEAFHVQVHLLNGGTEKVAVDSLGLQSTDGKAWQLKAEGKTPKALGGSTDSRVRFGVTAPADASLTRPFYSRPNGEQPYYNLNDERFRNLSTMPYPLAASAHLAYRGVGWDMREYVQTKQHVEGIGIVSDPLLIAPAISVAIAPGAGAVPLEATAFTFTCSLHSNVKGPAKGMLHLSLPDGWQSSPASQQFEMKTDGETQTVTFQVLPRNITQQEYEIRAEAEYGGKTYREGYRMIGYPGIRHYPYYRPAVYEAVGVQVTTAPNLHVAFIPGTGDEVPRALEDLGISVRILSASDLQSTSLEGFDAIVLGVRAYAAQPELRASNNRLLKYVEGGGTMIVQYNTQSFGSSDAPFPLEIGSRAATVVDETSAVEFLLPDNPLLKWPNKISAADFGHWQEERGHGFLKSWDPRYVALTETHDPEQSPQKSGLLLARFGKGFYIYDAFALYRQLPAGVPGAYRILANLVSASKNPNWK